MSDLISRQDVIEKINERARETFSLAPGYEHYLSALHDVEYDLGQIPIIDAVQVVRCRDCKWWGDLDPKNRYTDCYCHVVECSTEPEWFCADGERKQDG